MAVYYIAVPLLLVLLSTSSPYVNGNSILETKCSSLVKNMSTCLSFVTIGSRVDKPDALCCSGLKTMLDTKPECLCAALKKSASKGIKVNIPKAATLFALCKLDGSPPTTVTSLAPRPLSNHGSSLLPISGLSFAIRGALVILFLSYLSPLGPFG